MNPKSKRTPAAESGRDVALNDDVLTEILLLLPAKSLTRSKLVCKRWFSLISADQFCRLYVLRRPKSQSSLIVYTGNSRFHYFNPISNGENQTMLPYSFNIANYPQIPQIMSSSNGLMLITIPNPKTDDYYVYNPSTKQSRLLTLNHSHKYIHVAGFHLAFDPLKSPRYRIVCVRSEKTLPANENTPSLATTRSYLIEVYDSQSHIWSVFRDPYTAPSAMNFSYGVHCNNLIYGKTLYGAVYYIDIDKNVIRFLPRPMLRGAATSHRSEIHKSGGSCLYYSAVVSHRGRESVAVWELLQGNDDPRWLLKYNVGVGRLGILRPVRRSDGDESGILRFVRGSDGDETMVVHIAGKIGAYSFVDKSYKELVDLRSYQFGSLDLSVHQFGDCISVV